MRATGPQVFSDRRAAGVLLARELERRALQGPLLILGLPRGGVPIAAEVAYALHAPLDVMIVRKVGMPGQPELAIGAIASGPLIVREPHADALGVSEERFQQIAARELLELKRREHVYRSGRGPLDLKGKTVVLADDGLATGATMLAAVRAARQAGAAAVIVAAPVASRQAERLVGAEADAVIVLQTPPALSSIGEWYESFEQLDDATVCRLLQEQREPAAAADDDPAATNTQPAHSPSAGRTLPP